MNEEPVGFHAEGEAAKHAEVIGTPTGIPAKLDRWASVLRNAEEPTTLTDDEAVELSTLLIAFLHERRCPECGHIIKLQEEGT